MLLLFWVEKALISNLTNFCSASHIYLLYIHWKYNKIAEKRLFTKSHWNKDRVKTLVLNETGLDFSGGSAAVEAGYVVLCHFKTIIKFQFVTQWAILPNSILKKIV